MTCTDAHADARAARRALLSYPAVAGISLTSPRADPYDAWTLEVCLVTEDTAADGFEPAMQRTAAYHDLSVREMQPRSPTSTRVVLTL